ncbi:MAG: exodeoxyribonuclease VII small subunit [Oscillospiraceae bacterium]|nr:exodeoxyribonuclease VII small subunit [Oscillospiraceae bacterium]
MAESKLTFEDAMKRIEEIVSVLENGNSSLDESLELFEEATKLCAFCNKRLETAEQKVKSLAINNNEDK